MKTLRWIAVVAVVLLAGGWWSLRSIGSDETEWIRVGKDDLVLSVGERPGPRWRPFWFDQFGGFGYSIGRDYTRIWVPFWFPVCVFAAYPCFVFFRTRLRRRVILERQLEGLCTRCAYDLTGNTSGVCPECGTRTGDG